MEQNHLFRLVTRRNFDGLACAALLKEQNLVRDVLFVHPKEVQDGSVTITEQDILTNLPANEKAHLVFSNRSSRSNPLKNVICDSSASSTARVVYNHYGGKKAFPRISDTLIAAVDQSNTAQFSQQEIVNPKGWVLFNFLMDLRTGIGRFRHFRLSNQRLIMLLIDLCRVQDIEQIMTLPDVQERVEVYFKHQQRFLEQVTRCAAVQGSLVVLDLRGEKTVWAGNRFMIYALNPRCSISLQVNWGPKRAYTVFSIGKSVLNRVSTLDVGQLAEKYGGGGHRNAGTCRADDSHAEEMFRMLVLEISRA